MVKPNRRRFMGISLAGVAGLASPVAAGASHAGLAAPRQDALEDPYAILGVLPGVSVDAIREAYHRLVRESHPDLVIAQGLPPECVALATARIARINAAYDQIAKIEARPT